MKGNLEGNEFQNIILTLLRKLGPNATWRQSTSDIYQLGFQMQMVFINKLLVISQRRISCAFPSDLRKIFPQKPDHRGEILYWHLLGKGEVIDFPIAGAWQGEVISTPGAIL